MVFKPRYACRTYVQMMYSVELDERHFGDIAEKRVGCCYAQHGVHEDWLGNLTMYHVRAMSRSLGGATGERCRLFDERRRRDGAGYQSGFMETPWYKASYTGHLLGVISLDVSHRI